jgi:hypothetical protein
MSPGQGQRRRGGARRSIRVDVKVNESEHADLSTRAGERGLSVARLLVDSALEVPLPAPRAERNVHDEAVVAALVEELMMVRGALGRVANNINQLARTANESGELPARDLLSQAVGEHRVLAAQFMRLGVRISRWSRGLPQAGSWAPEGESASDFGSEQWWARASADRQPGWPPVADESAR